MTRLDADETWTIDLMLIVPIVVAVVWARLFGLV
jgi:hypothetical protein